MYHTHQFILIWATIYYDVLFNQIRSQLLGWFQILCTLIRPRVRFDSHTNLINMQKRRSSIYPAYINNWVSEHVVVSCVFPVIYTLTRPAEYQPSSFSLCHCAFQISKYNSITLIHSDDTEDWLHVCLSCTGISYLSDFYMGLGNISPQL